MKKQEKEKLIINYIKLRLNILQSVHHKLEIFDGFCPFLLMLSLAIFFILGNIL